MPVDPENRQEYLESTLLTIIDGFYWKLVDEAEFRTELTPDNFMPRRRLYINGNATTVAYFNEGLQDLRVYWGIDPIQELVEILFEQIKDDPFMKLLRSKGRASVRHNNRAICH